MIDAKTPARVAKLATGVLDLVRNKRLNLKNRHARREGPLYARAPLPPRGEGGGERGEGRERETSTQLPRRPRSEEPVGVPGTLTAKPPSPFPIPYPLFPIPYAAGDK